MTDKTNPEHLNEDTLDSVVAAGGKFKLNIAYGTLSAPRSEPGHREAEDHVAPLDG
ncbi:MAG: hypothetical protein AAFP68_09370 [Pseudomonadota bacterium]